MAATYYDACLIDATEAGLVLEYQGRRLELPSFQPVGEWTRKAIGQTGVVEYAPEGLCWRFNAYLDQSLRRMSELDEANRLGWRNDAEPTGWTAPRTIVPGAGGAFVEDETEPVQIAVPPEFFDLCSRYQLTPEAALRGFIADACDLVNYVKEPRGDHYCSNGSDERMMAADYLNRAYCYRVN